MTDDKPNPVQDRSPDWSALRMHEVQDHGANEPAMTWAYMRAYRPFRPVSPVIPDTKEEDQ